MQKKYKISILGGYGLRNFGDDALMYILHKVMSSKYKKNNLSYICTPEKYLQNIIDSTDIIDISSYNNLQTDILIYGGGTQFYSFKAKRNLIYRIFINLKNPIVFIKKIKKKFFKRNSKKSINMIKTSALGIGVGPFLPQADKNVELNTKQLFLKMGFVGVRDSYSFNKCNKWGLNNVKQYADLCYLMNDEFIFDSKKSSTEVKKIGIVVRDWNHTKEGAAYYEQIIPLMEKLRQNEYKVNILLFSQKRDIYWLKKLKGIESVIIWDPDKDTIKKFLKILDSFDLFITARYHGAVFSTLLGKPFISIGVEQKLDMVSDLYQNGSKKWNYPFQINECLSYVNDIDKNYIIMKENIISNTKIQTKLAQTMIKDFINYLDEGKM